MILYMAVTCDKYELPVFVTESRPEMARFCGIPPDSVSSQCARNKKKLPSSITMPCLRLRRVVIDDDEEEE